MNGKAADVIVMRRPVHRVSVANGAQGAEAGLEVREGSTGRVVRRCPLRVAGARLTLVPRQLEPGPLELERVMAVAEVAEPAPAARLPVPDMAFYRKYTEAMLRRYLQMSVTAGRVPSLMGREMFRGNVTHCRTHTMEDVVIFCMDMEKMLARLQPMDQRLILRIGLQHYSQSEAAGMLGLSLRGAIQRYYAALDRLTTMLLKAEMLEPLKSCQ